MSGHLTVNRQQNSPVASTPTQCVRDLVKVLYAGKRFGNHVDEVWPSLFIGDMSAANDRYTLWKLGITHVVNVAHGSRHSQGSQNFYEPRVDYYGVPAHDSPSFDLSCYFIPSADYIQKALDGDGARVLVHCAVGVSRSASLVLAYLMIHHGFTLLQAINKVKEHRWIFPNRGFLRQLQALEVKLNSSGVTNPNFLCADSRDFDLLHLSHQLMLMTACNINGQRTTTAENDPPEIISSTATSYIQN